MGKRYTPPAVARLMGVDVHRVLNWIRAGELAAVNVATRLSGRPRYRISEEAIQEFERARAVMPAVKVQRRTRRKYPAVREYFK